ncbi:MAG TPA: ATP-binding cassette domain-containing protein [Hyphomicrobiaceae bacterium]|nr:ATP-binding cassette domain-containing protein [Hyphomicrobiaceae bacterium]
MEAGTAGVALDLDRVSFRVGATSILSNVSLDIGWGHPTVLMGPNGSGKTTLLRVMMALAEPTSGRITLASRRDGRPSVRAFVFQKPVMLKRSAAANVAFALKTCGKPADPAVVQSLLQRVGLRALSDRPARRLSGGEQQRLALARALALDPDILLLDEPTASLDPAQTKAVEEIIAEAARSGVKIVMATHDIGQARRLAGEVVFLAHGRVVEQTPALTFFGHPRSKQARAFLAGDLVI